MKYQPKKKYYNFKYHFYFLLIYIIILLKNSEAKNIKLSLRNNDSKIKVTLTSWDSNYI